MIRTEPNVIDITAIITIPMEELWIIPTNKQTMDILAEDDIFYMERLKLLEDLAKEKEAQDQPHSFRLKGRLYTFSNLCLRNIIHRDRILGKKNIAELEMYTREEYARNSMKYIPQDTEEKITRCCEDTAIGIYPVDPEDYPKIKKEIEKSPRFYRDFSLCLFNKLFYEKFFTYINYGYTVRVRLRLREEGNSFVQNFLDIHALDDKTIILPKGKPLMKNIDKIFLKKFKDYYSLKYLFINPKDKYMVYVNFPYDDSYSLLGFELSKKDEEETNNE